MSKPLALVIPAYNRHLSLERLLSSVSNLHATKFKVDLILSIEGGATRAVKQVANDFAWHLGEKKVIQHPAHLGLRQHILYCGELTKEYDNILLVEDDIYLSPYALEYASAASAFYEDEDRISGISLYAPAFSEIAYRPFLPEQTQFDGYFMAQASSWGQVWSRKQWTFFFKWYNSNIDIDFHDIDLPWNIKLWPETSWKRYFMAYLFDTDRYFFYPYVSLSTNFSDKGTHQQSNERHQVRLQTRQIDYQFPRFDEDALRYDIYQERLPSVFRQCSIIPENSNLIVDLYGNKPITENDIGSFLLSSKQLGLQPLKSYGLKLKPHEFNVLNNISGKEIFIYEISDSTAFTATKIRPVSDKELIYWSGYSTGLLRHLSEIHFQSKFDTYLYNFIVRIRLRLTKIYKSISRWIMRPKATK